MAPPRTTSAIVKVMRLAHASGLALPEYQSEDAAGMDIVAAVPAETPLILAPGARALVPTGLVLELPRGYEGQVRPRSGLALKNGITVLNSPGTIDSDYRGEVQVLLINLGSEEFAVVRGMRVAQLVISPVVRVRVRQATSTSVTARGAGGFGSTGSRSKVAKIRNAAPTKRKR